MDIYFIYFRTNLTWINLLQKQIFTSEDNTLSYLQMKLHASERRETRKTFLSFNNT
jgi:hypothetical protein